MLRLTRCLLCIILLCLPSADSWGSEAHPPVDRATQGTKKVDFAHEIVPLLKAHCGKCHTGRRKEGDFSMNTQSSLFKSQAVVAGNSEKSPLIARVTSRQLDERMPPEGERLADDKVALLRRWIDQGAEYDDGFSFGGKNAYSFPLALTKPVIPPSSMPDDHPLDRIVDAYFKSQKIAFPPPVDDATFARRVHLDLVGLLPQPAELAAFLADTSSDKRARLIDRLLAADVAYADHWFTFWCDLLRNDFTGTGYIDGGREQITAWLYDALQSNVPYDRFVRELMAPSPVSRGFVKGIRWRGNVNASQIPEMQFAQNVSQVFLGINLKCASCHDSFVNDWKLADAYNFAAIIADAPLELHRCDVPQGTMATPAFLFPELGAIDAGSSPDERLRQLAAIITDPQNGRLPRTIVNRLWHRLMGRGVVHPVDAMDAEPWSIDLLDYLAGELVSSGYDLRTLLRVMATSRIYQAECVEPPAAQSADEPVFRGPIARRLTAEQFIDAVWRIADAAPSAAAVELEGRQNAPIRASLVVNDPLMRSLGRPNRDQVVSSRPEDVSMLEALDLSNGAMMADYVARGATHWLKTFSSRPPVDLIDALYLEALSRHPSQEEVAVAKQLIGDTGTNERIADLLWCIFALPEFQWAR